MYVDASAILAIILDEDDAASFAARIESATTTLCTSPVSILEAVITLATRANKPIEKAEEIITGFLETCRIATISISPEIGKRAVTAYAQYGKGRNSKAKLNLGDVYSYACAKSYRVPLLYKGKDFVHTDLA
jgi:ribonuclease VapC